MIWSLVTTEDEDLSEVDREGGERKREGSDRNMFRLKAAKGLISKLKTF